MPIIQKEAVQVILVNGDLIGVVYNNTANRDRVFYKVDKMDEKDIEDLFSNNKIND